MIEPYKKYEYSAKVSGFVNYTDKNLEFSYIKNSKKIVTLDSSNEKSDLKYLKKIYTLQEELNHIDKQNYKNKQNISLISNYEKLAERKNYLLSNKALLSLKQQIESLKLKIKNKSFYIKRLYLRDISVENHIFVNAGKSLFTAYDISKLKINLYVKSRDLQNISKKKLLINNKLSKFKIFKISKIKDDIHISAYKVELIKKNDNRNFIFGEIVNVEFVQ
jgi:hypothetical protein